MDFVLGIFPAACIPELYIQMQTEWNFCTREDKLVFLTVDGFISLFLQVTLEYRPIAEIFALRKPLMYPANHSVPEKLQCGILGAAVPVICYPCATWRQLGLSKCGNNLRFHLHHVGTSACPSETSKCVEMLLHLISFHTCTEG